MIDIIPTPTHTRRRLLVGIVGAPGTGKSTVARRVAAALRGPVDDTDTDTDADDTVIVVPMDG